MRLFIDGKEYPADVRQGFTLNYDEAVTRDTQLMRSGQRVAVTLPATDETDRLFADAGCAAAAGRFADGLHRAVVTVEGIEVVRGVIRLVKTVQRNGVNVCHRAEILTGAPQWVKNAAATMLHDTPVEFSRQLTPAEIVAGWTNDDKVKFFPVHRDSYELRNSSVSLLPPEKIMMTDDYHPFISVEAVVRAIFESAGYRLESRFMQSDEFRSLYMSGAYARTDVTARKRTMDFLAGRLDDVSATADSTGRVYASASVAAYTVGNLVCTAAEQAEQDGQMRATGFFSNNGCFSLVNGVAAFTPRSAVKVGFEYDIAYVTDYEIESRTRLRGFDTIYLGGGVHIPFRLANRFKDHREAPLAGYGYKLMIFGNRSGKRYRLTALVNGQAVNVAETESRMCSVTMPAGEAPQSLLLYELVSAASDRWRRSTDDWALYAGYVEEKGRTEVEITLRTPPEEIAAGAVRRFNLIYFEGADKGMTLTLLRRTTLRPVFTSQPAYGSHVTFADVARAGIRQTVLLDALQQMFNLRFLTDERTRTVFAEPCDDFYTDGTADWTDRIDFDSEAVFEDPSAEVHQVRTLAYRAGEGAVLRFESENDTTLGSWSIISHSTATLEGQSRSTNPLFAATLNAGGVFDNAEDALIMEVCDRDGDNADDDTFFTPRIVRYAGMQPLPDGQRWGFPASSASYPLAAFHHGGEGGFTLCFEERDGVQGLNRYHLNRMLCEERGPRVTLTMHLTPDDAAGLFACKPRSASVRTLFRLRTAGQSALYTLEAVKDYNPARGTARCTFLKTDLKPAEQ